MPKEIKQYEKMHDFFPGVAIKPKGRPRKRGTELPPSVQQLSRLTQLQYELSRESKRKMNGRGIFSRLPKGSENKRKV